jgi:predicted amidohydrolase
MSGPTRVAVVQIDGQPAASLKSCLDPLGDPLFTEKHGGVLPMAGDVDEPLQPTIRELRDRVRRTYCEHQARKVRAILDACRGWGVKVVVFPEYSIPWQVLDEVAAAAGEMVVVAGTHAVTQQGRTSGVYERLGTETPRGNEAVAPVLYQGKALALVPKLHAAPPERGGLREADAWSHVTLPTGLPSPLGVLICLDFLVRPGHQPSDVTRDKLAEARLLAVPSWTPTHTLREFEGAAWASAVRGRTPVLYANVAAQGGSTIYADTEYGKDAGRFPSQVGRLDAGDEGVVVVDIDLSDQRRGTRSMYLDHRIVTPFAQASLVYQTHPAGLAYARWLTARGADLAGDDLAPLVTALRADDAVLRAAGQLPGATARGLRVRRLFGDLELLNEVHEVARLLREVVLPTEVVPPPALLAALASGAETHLNDVLFRPDTRGHARELVVARDALHKGAALVRKLSDAEWTAEARATLAALAASVRGAAPAVAEPAVRVEPRPLPRALPLLSLPDQTVTIDGAARRLVFRATAREALAGLYREVPGEASLGQRITDVLSDNRDARIVDTAALAWRAKARAAVVLALGPTQERLAELASDDMQRQYVLARGMGRLALHGITPWSRLALLERTHDGCRATSLRAPKDVQSHWDDRMKDAVGQALHDLGLGPVEWIEEPPATIAGRVVGLRRRIEAARDTIVELRERRLREVGGHYVDPDVEVGDRRVPAREALDGWLADGGPPLALVLGEFGAGKSTLLADWCLHRWQTDAGGPLPVLVDLAGAGEHADALTLVLGACGLDDSDASRATVEVLVREGHLVPCFDGFDEMATRLQAEALAGRLASLTRIVADGGRAVVSSRSNYFPREQDLQAAEQALAEVLARSAAHQRVEVRPFDEDHIRRLVTSVAGAAAAPELLRRIQTTYDLRDLARRPLLLGMVLQTLERLPAGKRVTQAVLYEQYLARWLANTHVGDQEVFTDAQKRAFAEALAEALWRTGASSLTWQALHGTVRELLFRELPDDVPGGSGFLEIAGGAFFVRDGDDHYRFAHKSFLEYFLARSLVSSLAAGTTRGLDTRPLSAEVIAFALEVLSLEAADAPWRHPAIATVQRWLEVGRAAEGDPVTTANAAANALRFLVGLGRSTYPDRWLPDRADLRKVVLDGEDLSGAILRAADLSGASLRGVRLSDVVLDGAKLDGAILDGATLDRASLHRAGARGASFIQASATDAELQGANLDGANLRQSVWVGGTWADCSYAGATATAAVVASPQGAPRLPSLDLVAHLRSGHAGDVVSVGWSADGRIASGGHDGRVCVWDGATLARQGAVEAHAGSVWSVGWSADGRVVSGGADGRVCVWDGATLARQGEVQAHAGSVASVGWSADGRVVSGGADGRVCVWDGATLARQAR